MVQTSSVSAKLVALTAVSNGARTTPFSVTARVLVIRSLISCHPNGATKRLENVALVPIGEGKRGRA
jgi:hypothetical protein